MSRYADYLRRKADAVEGIVQPDARDDELRDRGIELEWRRRVQRREARYMERRTNPYTRQMRGAALWTS